MLHQSLKDLLRAISYTNSKPICIESQAALGAIPNILSQVNPHASLIGLLSLALCTFTPRKVSRIVPGSLLALVIGTLVATMGNLSKSLSWENIEHECHLVPLL